MRKNDIIGDIALALVLLTRLPLPALPEPAFQRQSKAVWAFPLAGLAVALPACAAAAGALWLGLPPAIAAGLLLAVQILLSGAMHEDGLADSADGLWGGLDAARRLEIMKDSQIGSYGVLALILTVGLRWLALTTLIQEAGLWPVLALAALSRAAMPLVMAALPNARDSGLSQSVGRPSAMTCAIGLALAVLIMIVVIGSASFWVAAAMALTTGGLGLLAKVKISGQTGDILGATQQLCELVGLLVLLVLLVQV